MFGIWIAYTLATRLCVRGSRIFKGEGNSITNLAKSHVFSEL